MSEETSYYVYKLFPPRPTFVTDMTPTEAAVMAEHASYWRGLLDRGVAVAFGPVADPAGVYGLAVVEAGPGVDVERLRADDPAVRDGVATAELFPMLSAVVRR